MSKRKPAPPDTAAIEEADAVFARWAAEAIARNPDTVYNAEYRARAARHTDVPEFLQ